MDESEQIMRRYLLGELSESERSALEEKYFTDPQVFNQVLKTESELVDGYVRKQLPKEVRERIEQSYMAHPARAERVKFAAALATRVDQFNESVPVQPALPDSWWQRLIAALRSQPPVLRVSMALVVLLIILGGIWFLVDSRKRQREAAQIQAATEAQLQREREKLQQTADEARRAKESAEQARNSQENPQPAVTPNLNSSPQSVTLALTIASVRSGDAGRTPTLVIPPGTTQARLELNLKSNDFPSYRATLQTIAGAEILNQTNLKPKRGTGASFVFTVPAGRLESGDYVLTLTGVSANGDAEPLSKSLFRVEKK